MCCKNHSILHGFYFAKFAEDKVAKLNAHTYLWHFSIATFSLFEHQNMFYGLLYLLSSLGNVKLRD